MRIIQGTMPGFEGERDIAVLEGDVGLCSWIEENRRLDLDCGGFSALLPHLNKQSVVYDVGAFIGDHTAWFASLSPKAVVAFEAFPDAFVCLARNVWAYSDSTKLVLLPTIIGDGEPVRWAYGPDKRTRCVLPTAKAGLCSTRIDDLVEHLPPPTLLKIDVEGWEVKVLQGATDTIIKHHPVIVCEVAPHFLHRAGNSEAELFELLTEHGYTMKLFDGSPWEVGEAREGFDIIAEAK